MQYTLSTTLIYVGHPAVPIAEATEWGWESTPASGSDRPTALLYRRTAGGYELAGAMFTAPIASGSIDTKAACDAAGGFFIDVAKQF